MTPELRERLQFELKTIKEMGFADYFLIVWDFIHFAKVNGIGVGPGRGSAAGSLAAYSLEITDIDPIRYDLLFERFLNPGRKEMPDIDIDFAVDGRERVINYVSEKYGRDRVAQIITFGTMAARAAVRDAGRVLEIPYGVVDKIAKLIPEGPGQTLADCLKSGSDLKNAYDTEPAAKEIIDLARPLEGLIRQDSIHAAGVVIGAEPLIDVVPLQQKGADQEVVTQFSMNTVSALGLLKMDFLGLRNLDVIDKAVELIGGIDMTKIPLDDKKTYAMLARGEAMGVFQFESSGMREALRLVKPTVFEDLIALVALYRPGPMQYIPNYAKRKAGQEPVTYIDPRLKAITGNTYGIAIYQEQSMEIAKQIGGFSPAEADDLRKAIGKKIHSLMASLKDKFITGCIGEQHLRVGRAPALGRHREVAGLLVQQGARRLLRADRLPHRLADGEPSVRVHGSADLVGDDRRRTGCRVYVNACDELGIEVLPPDVNSSQTDFAVVEGKIRFGLNAVKSVGESAANAIIRAREAEGGPFESIWDFTERVDPQVVNKRSLEALVKCGALDSTGASRMGMLACLEQALAWGQKHASDRLAGQASIFDLGDAGDGGAEEQGQKHHPAIPASEFEKPELLKLEKETLGLYVSEHPLKAVREQLRRKTDCVLSELERRRDGEVVTVGGIVSAIKQLTTKRGEPMVFLALDDPTGGGEVVVFNSTYAAARELCVLDRILVIKGRIDHKQQGETKLIALEVSAFEAVQERTEIRFKLDAREARAGLIKDLAHLVKDYPGPSLVFVSLETSLGPKTLALGPDYRVAIDTDFLTEARTLLGADAIL